MAIVHDAVFADFGVAYNAGSFRIVGGLWTHTNRAIVTAPLSDSNLTVLNLSIVDSNGANLITPLTKAGFAAGAAGLTNFFKATPSKLSGITGGDVTTCILDYTYSSTARQVLFLPSRWNA